MIDATESREAWRAWEAAHAERVVDSVNFVRAKRGLTIRELAALLEEVGWPVGFNTLSGILSARKRGSFTIGELVAFSRALEVSVTYLMLGLPARSLPGAPFVEELANVEAAGWVAGALPASVPPIASERRLEGDELQSWKAGTANFTAAVADLIELNLALGAARDANAVLAVAPEFDPDALSETLAQRQLSAWAVREPVRTAVDILDRHTGPNALLDLARPAWLEGVTASNVYSLPTPIPGLADESDLASARQAIHERMRARGVRAAR